MPPRRRPPRMGSSDAATRRLLAARARQSRPEQNGHKPASPDTSTPDDATATTAAEATTAADPTSDTAASDAATSDTASASASTDADTSTDASADAGERATRSLRLPVLLAALTVILGSLAAWFGAEASNASGGASAQNSALTDASTTSQVSEQIAAEVGILFSYNYAAPGPTLAAERNDLVGAAVAEYGKLVAKVRADAPRLQLIVDTSVTSVGVEMLHGNTARLLVFGRESNRRASTRAGTPVAAMLAVNAVLQGGTWKISGIDTFQS